MNDKIREQLSAYLDGQLTTSEREQVEALLRRDPQARMELESMREFAGWITQAAPPAVSAPPDLRARIMDRVKAEAAGSSGGPGGSPAASQVVSWKSFVVAGAVMIGLVGSLAYLDQRRGGMTRPQPPAPEADLAPAGGTSGLAETTRTDAGNSQLRPAQADDIRSTAGQAGSTVSGGRLPEGRIFTFGRNGARADQALEITGTGSAAGATDVAELSRSGAAEPELESASGWTAERLRAVTGEMGNSSPAQAREILALARQYNINPGLLAAAAADFPDRSLTETAMRLRSSLNATHGQSAEHRLQQALADLGVRPERAQRWKRFLR